MAKLTTAEEARPRAGQHTRPCHDCPWRRQAIKGWLGGVSVEEWLAEAHGDAVTKCHTCGNQQCAGIAIYRRNVCKMPAPPNLVLAADREAVFANREEFKQYHQIRHRDAPSPVS